MDSQTNQIINPLEVNFPSVVLEIYETFSFIFFFVCAKKRKFSFITITFSPFLCLLSIKESEYKKEDREKRQQEMLFDGALKGETN